MSEKKHTNGRSTDAIRCQAAQTHNREHSVPLYLTSSFTFDSAEQARAIFAKEEEGDIYSRFSNPNYTEFEEKMCALEGTDEGVAVASGMSAIFTTFASILESGDELFSARSIFGSTHKVLTQILPRWGISHTYGDISETDTWDELVTPAAKICFLETPTNPTLDLVDLAWVREFCDRHDLLMIVDNAFATPIIQRPAEFGADIVIHSATKYIDGQGRGIGGIVLGREDLMEEVYFFLRHTGPSLSPFNAWMFSKSLETLPVRMEKHSENALVLAEHLEDHPDIKHVSYPYLPSHPQYELAKRQMDAGGGMVTCVATGGIERGARFLDALKICSLTANLGDVRTIATHPASTTHSKLSEEERRTVGILPGLIRISVGLEDIDDIIGDIDQALEKSKVAAVG